MVNLPTDLRQSLQKQRQDHVLAHWERLEDSQRRELLDQLGRLNLDQLQKLYQERDHATPLPGLDRIQPIPVTQIDPGDRQARAQGEEALRRGEVAVLLVAGGQGSRLGFEHPKGMYPVGPVSNHSLFQVHTEKVLALRRAFGKPIPFLIMTSPQNDAETKEFFAEHKHFGLPAGEIHFFTQGTMPALDLATGKLLMETPSRLFTSPNGHGGTLLALAESGLLDQMKRQGIRQIYYFQVDNPLVKIADPLFLGHHRAVRSEASSKVIPKNSAEDKLGNLVLVDGRCSIIEYSDLPKELARQTDASGQLRFRVGSPAIHIFDVDFLARVLQGEQRLPFHVARKKVPYLGDDGKTVQPEKENALKFEMFIFDALPRTDRWVVVETTRREEFEPLKNATGPDSPATVKQAISDLAGEWLEQAGVQVPRGGDRHVTAALEISPLYAWNAEELAGKVNKAMKIEGPTFLK
jgi:UDP-N-acetylglucosamine/UDP-N-acetylgalactosamine diphosphorylase